MSRAALLGAFGRCALSSAQEFRTAAAALEIATSDLASAPAPVPQATVDAAREAFSRAFDAWQVVEAMQFGPAARTGAPGGQGVRDHIYSWRLVSACAVDEGLVSRVYETPGLASTLINQHGLDELEQLLFQESAATACGASSSIVADGTWDALGVEERSRRRRSYAAAAAADVRGRADALVAAWDPAQGNFVATLETAGVGNPVFKSQQAALNAVSDAMFYVEGEVKDMKVAQPLGKDLVTCMVPPCLDLLESRFAARSKANIRQNLVGFRRIAEGCGDGFAGLGFDDLLDGIGATTVAADLRAKAAAAQVALDSIEENDLAPALLGDFPSVTALYEALRGITTVMKLEMTSVLQLELPAGVEGDVD